MILRLKCTIFDFRCGSAPDPLGELRALPLQGNKRERVGRGGASPLKYFGLEPPE